MRFLIVLAAFSVPGFLILGYGLYLWYRSSDAQRWPTTKGTVLSCSLRESVGGRRATTFEAIVQYSYTVGGKRYESDSIAIGYGSTSNRDHHEAIVEKLNGASSIVVRYNPADPGSSVISYGFHSSIRGQLALGCMWLLFCGGIALTWYALSSGPSVLAQNIQLAE